MSDDLFDFGSWFDGNDLDLNDGGDSGSSWNASDPDLNSQWAVGGGDGINSSSGVGANSGSGFNWGSLIGPGIGALGGLLQGIGNKQDQEDLLKLQSQLSQQNYAAQLAEQEKYYQSHGKQLADAYAPYAAYAAYTPNATNIFGLLTPKPKTGPLQYGWQ